MFCVQVILALSILSSAPTLAQNLPSRSKLEQIGQQAVEGRASTSLRPEVPPIPGLSIAVARGDDIVFAAGFGHADLENDIAATESTVYRIGSVTKQFTAAAILQLCESGKLDLDDPLSKFLGDYPEPGNAVTVHQLLNHTSGILSYTSIPGFMARTSSLPHTDEELIALFRDAPLLEPAGERFRYNNSGYVLLGVLVEKASGQTYSDYLEAEIFEPLELHDSCYGSNEELIKNRAHGYDYVDGEFKNCGYIHMSTPGGAGALCSTVVDLVRWTHALMNFEVVGDEQLEAMTSVQAEAGGPSSPGGYGYGLFIKEVKRQGEENGHAQLSHGGGIHGFTASLSHFPDYDLTVALLANSRGAALSAVEEKILQLCLPPAGNR